MAKKSNTEQNQTPKLNPFEQAIKAYLDGRAAEDELFAKSYAKDGKSIKECCQYIIGEAEKKRYGRTAVMSDAEVYGLAVHYYDEDNIEINREASAEVMHDDDTPAVDYVPTEEEKEHAKQAALKRLEDEAYRELHRAPKKRKQEEIDAAAGTQTSLFDLMQ